MITIIKRTNTTYDSDLMLEVPGPLTLRDLIDTYGSDFGYSNNLITSVNHAQTGDFSHIVRDGDRVEFTHDAKKRG